MSSKKIAPGTNARPAARGLDAGAERGQSDGSPFLARSGVAEREDEMTLARFLPLCIVLAAHVFAHAAFAAGVVKFGDLGIVGDAPFYIAEEKGWFAEAGIRVVAERLESAANATVPLAKDELQVVTGGLSAGLFNAFARGLPLRIVMGSTRDVPGFSSDTLLLREDLRAKVQGVTDLKGMRIALNAPAGSLEYLLGRVLQHAGLGLGDVDVKYISWPSQAAALANAAIDVGAVSEPFATLYTEKKLAFPWHRAADLLSKPQLQISVVIFGKLWTDADPEQAAAFATAYLRGMRAYHAAMKGGPERAEVVAILTRHTSLKDPALFERIQWSYMDPNGDLELASLQDQVDWFASQGSLAERIDVAAMVDSHFLGAAQAKLGRVEAK